LAVGGEWTRHEEEDGEKEGAGTHRLNSELGNTGEVLSGKRIRG